MTKKLDLKGKACPIPVVETKKALDSIEEGIIVVEVDNEVSKNNVERFAKKKWMHGRSSRKKWNFYFNNY